MTEPNDSTTAARYRQLIEIANDDDVWRLIYPVNGLVMVAMAVLAVSAGDLAFAFVFLGAAVLSAIAIDRHDQQLERDDVDDGAGDPS